MTVCDLGSGSAKSAAESGAPLARRIASVCPGGCLTVWFVFSGGLYARRKRKMRR
jgi:hypothetical protein